MTINPLLKKVIQKDKERPLFTDIREEHLPEWAKDKRAELTALSKETECTIVVNPVHPEHVCGEIVNGVCGAHDLSDYIE